MTRSVEQTVHTSLRRRDAAARIFDAAEDGVTRSVEQTMDTSLRRRDTPARIFDAAEDGVTRGGATHTFFWGFETTFLGAIRRVLLVVLTKKKTRS